METKVNEWLRFTVLVKDHIMKYVLPQYGDHPDEMIDGYTIKDIKSHLERYVKRIGTGSRGIEEAKRDALKIAHYACYLLRKLNEVEKDEL